MSATTLYTPEVLGLATGLAGYGWDDSLPFQGSARSRSCGSAITLGLSTDADRRIADVAIRSQACAIGQAAAAIFAQGAQGRDAADIRAAYDGMTKWLSGDAPMPDWPGLAAIAPARDYPGRHAAILLAWQAASEILHTD